MKSLRGQFLIASPKLGDSNFAETVVFVVRHDLEGALGLVLNQPLDITVQEACGNSSLSLTLDIPLFCGGPCEGPLMVLHAGDGVKSEQVIPGVRFATEAGQILEALETSAKSKCFAGYSGWSPGQLETEMEADAWLVVDGNASDIFENDPELYNKLRTRIMFGPWVDPKDIPEDPSVN